MPQTSIWYSMFEFVEFSSERDRHKARYVRLFRTPTAYFYSSQCAPELLYRVGNILSYCLCDINNKKISFAIVWQHCNKVQALQYWLLLDNKSVICREMRLFLYCMHAVLMRFLCLFDIQLMYCSLQGHSLYIKLKRKKYVTCRRSRTTNDFTSN